MSTIRQLLRQLLKLVRMEIFQKTLSTMQQKKSKVLLKDELLN